MTQDLFEAYNEKHYGKTAQDAAQSSEPSSRPETPVEPESPEERPASHKYWAENLETEKMLLEQASDPLKADFEAWKETPGANHVLQDLYKLSAHYAKRYKRYGRRVSMKLLWETERDRIRWVRERLRRRGMDLQNWKGYALNNNLHSLIARHIIDHRPEWDGMFEMRERKAS